MKAVLGETAAAVLLTLGLSYAVADVSPTFLREWGTFGTADGQFNGPTGIACAGSSVYVVEAAGNRVQKFDTSGVFQAKWSSTDFAFPNAIALGPSGDAYVVSGNLILEFTSSGSPVRQWGGFGSGNGQFSSPAGVAIDGAGDVFVTDTGNHRVQKFTPGGVFLQAWGTMGSADGQFISPWGIAIDASGNVFVGDHNNANAGIQKFDNSGAFLLRWGTAGTSGPGEFGNVAGLAVNPSGNVIAADMSNDRIQVFTGSGAFILGFGSSGAGGGQFSSPKAVTTDAVGNIYVADTGNNRIEKFGPGATPAEPTSWGRVKAAYR